MFNILFLMTLFLISPNLVFADNTPIPHDQKVMIVIFENTDYTNALSQPFFGKLAREGALLTKMNGITHPSQSNYIALTAGDMAGVWHDFDVTVDVRHIGDLVEEKGKSWKVYAEDYPGNCFLGSFSSDGLYVRRHVPFLSFKNVQDNPDRCARVVDASELHSDVSAENLPDYSFYVPNIRNDGHDTNAAYADQWLGKTFGPLLSDPKFNKNMLLIITFDESTLLGGNHIYTTFYGEHIRPGARFDQPIDHYGILHTIEETLGLESLGQHDATAPVVSGIWR